MRNPGIVKACERCGEKFTAHSHAAKYCRDCVDARSLEFIKARYAKRKENKVCVVCGVGDERTQGGMTLCKHCAILYHQSTRLQNKTAAEAKADMIARNDRKHICPVCGREVANDGFSVCYDCRNESRSNLLINAHQGICARCGRKAYEVSVKHPYCLECRGLKPKEEH